MYLRSLAIFWHFCAGLLLISDSSPHSPQNLSLGAIILLQPGQGPSAVLPRRCGKTDAFPQLDSGSRGGIAVPYPSMDFIRLDRGRLSIILIFLPMESAPKTGTDLR